MSMLAINRRDIVLSAAGAALALGLPRRVTFLGAAPAAAATMTEKGFHRFSVGDIEMTAIFDGEWAKPHDEGFIKGVSVEDTKLALAGGGLAIDAVHIPFTVMAASIAGRTVLFDAGTGGQLAPTAGLLRKSNLAAAGIDAATVATIVVTHFHPDHIFGLMEKDTNAPLFPNAEILVGSGEYAFWSDAGVIAKLPERAQGLARRIQAVFPGWKNIRRIDGEAEVAPGIRSVPTPGHTAGHTSYLVSSGGKALYVLGDVSNIPALFLKNPGWHVSFDADGAQAEATRRAMMDRAIAEGAMVAGYHFPFPTAGTVARDGGGYAFVPVA
jgi:glyoxylase-like metal-dependent hydrolase (beta-lactamase superfamily II)